jgi:hypothetical protein
MISAGEFVACRLEHYNQDIIPPGFSDMPVFRIILSPGRLTLTGNPQWGFPAALPGSVKGYFCAFRYTFFPGTMGNNIRTYFIGDKPAEKTYNLNKEESEHLSIIILKLLDELSSGYQFRYYLVANYVLQVLHFAMKAELSRFK